MDPRDDRRQFLRTGLAAGTMVGAAGLEGILAARRAPVFAQTTKIHLLQWVDFMPEGDVEVRRQVADYTKQTKVEVTFETINANDLQARITAAIQSGAGPELILMLHNWPHLYANALVDVSDLSDWKTKDQGGYYSHCEVATKVGSQRLALPYGTGGILTASRQAWFAEVGALQPPKTLDEYRKIGTTVHDEG